MMREARKSMSHVDEGQLHAYLDGALPPGDRERVDAHLAECPGCRQHLEEARALITRADALLALARPVERPAPPLHELRRPPLWWRVRGPVAWAATVVLAVGVGWVLRAAREPATNRNAITTAAPDTTTRIAVLDRADKAVSAPARQEKRAERPARVATEERGRTDSVAAGADGRVATGVFAPSMAPPPPPSVTAREAAPLSATKAAPAGALAPLPQAAAAPHRAPAVLSSTWPIIQRDPARHLLGTDLAMIPGVPVRDIRMSPFSDGVVVVQQEIDSATVIQLYERRADAAAANAHGYVRQDQGVRGRDEAERLARFIGPLRVEIAGPLGTDSLSKLLELVK
jgi:anti-sigma factor RsiW